MIEKRPNKLFEFISEIKNSDKTTNLPEKEIQTIDYKTTISNALSEEYRHPLQKDFIFSEIQINKPSPGKKYPRLNDKSMEYLLMKYHLYDVKLKKGYKYKSMDIKRGSMVSVLDKNIINELPMEFHLIYQQSFNQGNTIFYYNGDIFTLSPEYFRTTIT